ncbi:DNA helicase MCM9-like [Anopheles aquasalis]|uniref:DNA helicase MCM9-like n=1 Tax=Anopheles aquasalis TaxID=42839 RepID=UPI00215A1143|nr:DNA helicase MCM9-like [Anopheles aquasalis]
MAMEAYLKQYHDEEITDLLNNPDDLLHVSIHVNLSHLQRKQPVLYERILQNTDAEVLRWNECLLRAQKALIEGNLFLEPGFQIKQNCHTRFVNMPISPTEVLQRKQAYPSNDHVGQFLQVKGSVIRMTSSRFLEFKREYTCTRCKCKVLLEADYGRSYVFDPPGACPAAKESGCRGHLQAVSAQPQPEYCRDYQEIRIQEIMSERNVPASLVVTLEDDLVDTCQPGDCVTVCGRIEHRWKPPVLGKRTEVSIAMRANSLAREESKASWAKDLPEHLLCVQAEWQEVLRDIGELAARDMLVQSIAPNIRGMYPVKLAVALALASCTERPVDADQQTGTTSIRGHSHLLLVGDPGLAKSQLLKFASEIASRAVYTTGMGCSSAGLTAAAVKDEGEWQLEAGALVLADGGICCIDEFNLMREPDKASIHEAMEQQTISVAKAGMVCKLSTRCVVLAATNPKNLYTMSDGEGTSAANIGIGGPLLSRFDIVLILRDIRAPDWDADIASHLLSMALLDEEREQFGVGWYDRIDQLAHWDLEKLQLHFAAIKDIHPRVSPEANMILGAYYRACRSDPFRDPTRTTVRLLDSLFRLAQAHARLLFRTEVTPIDAITVIELMEASWGFGKIGITPYDPIKAKLPLGPEQSLIDRLLSLLQLGEQAVLDSATVRPIDPNVLRRYQRDMIAKQKAKQAAKEKEEEQQHRGLFAAQSALSQQQQQPLSGFTPPSISSTQITAGIPTATATEPNQQTNARDYSKYAIQPRTNLKKLKKAPTGDEAEPAVVGPGSRKRKHQLVEEDPSLKTPLDDQELGGLLDTLRKNFATEELDVSPPDARTQIDGFTGLSNQTSQTSQNKNKSFSALLDSSKVFGDDDENDFFTDELIKVSSSSVASKTPNEPIKDEQKTVPNGHPKGDERLPSLDDTVLTNIGTEAHSQSAYQIKRPSQRQLNTTQMVASLVTSKPNTAINEEEDDLLNFEIEPSGSCPLLNEEEDEPATGPGIRTQTRQRLQEFEFHVKLKSDPPKDDSAYDSMRDHTRGGRHDQKQGGQQSQYSGLLSDLANNGEDGDIELNLSDIEL